MTHRHTVDTITSDALDTLYQRAERAETALKRVRDLATATRNSTSAGRNDWQIGQHDMAFTILAALDEPGPAGTQATKQPEIITDRATIRTALDEPGCTCTYGNRCPNCRD